MPLAYLLAERPVTLNYSPMQTGINLRTTIACIAEKCVLYGCIEKIVPVSVAFWVPFI